MPPGSASGIRDGPSMLGHVRAVLLLAGLLLVVAGAVWIGQRLNLPFAPRSFTTRDLTWTAIGAVTLVAGLGLAGYAWRRR